MAGHEKFSTKVWPNKKRRSSEIYNRWKFRGPIQGKVEGLLLAVEDGKVLGQLGLMPVTLKNKKKTFEAQWACDLIVDPDYRKHGVGNKLFEVGIRRDKITLGNNPSPKAEALMLKSGFRPIPSGRLMVFPIDPEQLISWALPGKMSKTAPFVKATVGPYFDFKKRKISKHKRDFEFCSWRDLIDLVSMRQQNDERIQILHDENFLQWRAAGLINFSPEVKAIRSPLNSYALYTYFKPYLNVYEWHCTNPDDFKGLISSIIDLAERENAKTVQIVSNAVEEQMVLSKMGFIKSRNMEKIIYYSNQLELGSQDKFYFTLYDTDLNL